MTRQSTPKYEVRHTASWTVVKTGVSKTEATKFARAMAAGRPGSFEVRPVRRPRALRQPRSGDGVVSVVKHDPIIRAEWNGNKYYVPESWCDRLRLPTPILAAGIPLVLFAAVFCFAVIITIGG